MHRGMAKILIYVLKIQGHMEIRENSKINLPQKFLHNYGAYIATYVCILAGDIL